MWPVASRGGDTDWLWLSGFGCRWATVGESAKLPVNSLTLQRCIQAWKQMNKESVIILTEPKTELGMSDEPEWLTSGLC